jgi:hypothetical protein
MYGVWYVMTGLGAAHGKAVVFIWGYWTETNWFTTQSCKIVAELGKVCCDQMFPELKKRAMY